MIDVARKMHENQQSKWERLSSKEMNAVDRVIIDHAQAALEVYLRHTYPEAILKPYDAVVVDDSNHFIPHGGVSLERFEDSLYGDAQLFLSALHESSHAQSYSDSLVLRDQIVRRIGFGILITAPNRQESYFVGLNEAMTMAIEYSTYHLLPDNNHHAEAISDRAQEILPSVSDPVERQCLEQLPEMATILPNAEGEYEVLTTYYQDYLIFATLMNHIAEALPDEFANSEVVQELFGRAYFSGDLKEVKRIMRDVYGSRGMQVLAQWTPTHRSYSRETLFRLKDFIRTGTIVDIDSLIKELHVSKCSTCGEKTGGSVCIHCATPRREEKEVQDAVECKFCGSFIGVSNGVCRECGS